MTDTETKTTETEAAGVPPTPPKDKATRTAAPIPPSASKEGPSDRESEKLGWRIFWICVAILISIGLLILIF